jgi:hypothetical protein
MVLDPVRCEPLATTRRILAVVAMKRLDGQVSELVTPQLGGLAERARTLGAVEVLDVEVRADVSHKPTAARRLVLTAGHCAHQHITCMHAPVRDEMRAVLGGEPAEVTEEWSRVVVCYVMLLHGTLRAK